MLNIEKYKNFVMNNLNYCQMETDMRKEGNKATIDCEHILCEDCKESFFKWLLSEYKEPVLDEVEKAYLSAVIKPYKNRVISITKVKDAYETKRFIRIVIKGNYGREEICLPWFKGNTKYKGMKDFKGYTLDELGL